MDFGKFSTACCSYETRTRKHRFETIATMARSSASLHVAGNNEYLARQKPARFEQIRSKLAFKR